MGVFTNAESAERIIYGETQKPKANCEGFPFGKFNSTFAVASKEDVRRG